MNLQVKENAIIHNKTSNFIATVVKCIFFFLMEQETHKVKSA